MENRRYQVAFFIAKLAEIFSWIILIGGIIFSIYLATEEDIMVAVAAFVASLFLGLNFIFYSQVMLIYIDTENNTRQIAEEMKKANAMLSQTLGVMVARLGKLVDKE